MVKYDIRYSSSNPSRVFDVNDLEELFFEKLFSKFQEAKLKNYLNIVRLSNGTLAVDYAGYPIGKIKLQGRTHNMQVIKGLYKHYSIEGDIQDFLPKIDEWVKYVQRYVNKYLFSYEGKKLSNSQYYIFWNDIMKQLGMEHTPHECRHTFRSRLDSAGANKVCIDLMMGHKSKEVGERIYTHKTIQELKEAIELIDKKKDEQN